MKKLVIGSTLLMLSLSADYQDSSVSLNVDNRDSKFFYQSDITFQHQSTFELSEDDGLFVHALSNPKFNKSCHHELGIGYRRLYEDFGFGTNFVYGNQYAHSFFNHQLVPGIELFYKKFMAAYNRYLPFKTSVKLKDAEYLFHDVSEISLSYRPSRKYEICLSPFYNHQTMRFGYAATVSASFLDNWNVSLTPYCEPYVQHGVAFSLTMTFGGPADRLNRKMLKSHRFFYTSKKEEILRFKPAPTPVIIPTVAPIVLKPVEQPKVEPGKTPPEPKGWLADFFGWKTAPSKK